VVKSAPRWRKSTNDGSKTSCALPHRSRGQVSVGFHGIKSKKGKNYFEILDLMKKNMENNNKIKSKNEIKKFINYFFW